MALAPPHTRVTAADVVRDEQRTRNVVEQVVQLFSLQPEDSPVHKVAPYCDGIEVVVPIFEKKPVGVYALPWSRGWSIYADEVGHQLQTPYAWRSVKREYASLGKVLYAPRECTGPWLVPPSSIAEAVTDMVEHLQKLDRARRLRFSKKHWYWPRTAMLAKMKGGD